jgi:hypothetical protein
MEDLKLLAFRVRSQAPAKEVHVHRFKYAIRIYARDDEVCTSRLGMTAVRTIGLDATRVPAKEGKLGISRHIHYSGPRLPQTGGDGILVPLPAVLQVLRCNIACSQSQFPVYMLS